MLCPWTERDCEKPRECNVAMVCCRAPLSENVGPMQQGVERAPCRLNQDSAARKNLPVTTGVLDYFPDAIAAVARLSKIGNDKHNPGQPLHWSRGKSNDHADCIGRHLIDRGTLDPDGVLHDVMLAWRALANLQLVIEDYKARGEPFMPE